MRLIHKLPFVLAATDQGTMIVNRFDYNYLENDPEKPYGVGHQILEYGSYDPKEADLLKKIASLKFSYRGDDDRVVLVLDCGANIGVHTIALGKHMNGWGQVVGVEAQEQIYYALAGNIVLNNCLNAYAYNAAIHNVNGQIEVPVVDYEIPASFGSLELVKSDDSENIGQPLLFNKSRFVVAVTIDSFRYPYLDIIKLDVEGMELLALDGAKETLPRTKPVLLIENMKCGGHDSLVSYLSQYGYVCHKLHINTLAVHENDPIHLNNDLENEINHDWKTDS